MKPEITKADIYEAVRELIEFPYAQVCRHYVACNLLDLLERKGFALDTDLVRAVVRADDEAALALLPPVQPKATTE